MNLRAVFISLLLISIVTYTSAQNRKIQELEFLIGTWEVREDNKENGWREEAVQEGKYILEWKYEEKGRKSFD